MNIHKVFDFLLYYIALPLTALSYVLIGLTNDARIYIGVEYIADTFYPLPQGWDLAWEIKPIANRVFNWALFKVANVVIPLTVNPVAFAICVKILALVIITCIAWYFSRAVKGEYIFALTFLALTAIANFVIMQAEYWAVAFSLVAIALILSENENLHALAGAMFVFIGLFKGITGLMFIPILCAVLLLKPKIRMWLADLLFGFLGGAGLFFMLNATIFPHMLSDILMSAQVARVGMHPPLMYALSTGAFLFAAMLYIPILIFGLFAGIVYFIRLLLDNKYRKALLFAGMWAVPFVIVFTQGEFFIYQYYVLTIPAIVTLILWGRKL